MKKSKIEWTESTWNPVTGCEKISPGCENCYAERMAKRLQAMGQSNYKYGFSKVCTHDHALEMPLKWKKPQMIFVNSMSDLFHKNIPFSYIRKVFKTMNLANQHTFQVLTKRADRLYEIAPKLNWTENIWMGVTVENRDYLYRLEYLKKTNAKIKFISFEPLLDSIGKVKLNGIDWIVVGGESGPGARPMSSEWVSELKSQSKKFNVPFFFKQWGGVNKKKNGRLLNGRTYDELPKIPVLA
jgi:protein gp37